MTHQPDLEVDIAVRKWWPSTNIAGVGYHEASHTLEIRFKGVGGVTAYRYGNVTLSQAAPLLTEKPERRLLGGLSPGAYLSRVFVRRPERHPFVKLEEDGPGRAGADYYYALRRVVGARRSGMSEKYIAAVCAEAATTKVKWGPWPSRS